MALWTRVRAHAGTKIAVLLGLSIGICVPYFTLQRLDAFPPREPPVLPIDGWVAFEPAWIWAYLSIALLVPLAPLLAMRKQDLARYARGLTLLCLACFAAFLFFPVEGPRPDPIEARHAMYEWLVSVDRPSNSLPSLHAGLVVYSLLFGFRVLLPDLGSAARVALGLCGALWGSLILFSTLATRQHWALDLPAGVLLAGAAHALAWRDAKRAPRAEELPLFNL